MKTPQKNHHAPLLISANDWYCHRYQFYSGLLLASNAFTSTLHQNISLISLALLPYVLLPQLSATQRTFFLCMSLSVSYYHLLNGHRTPSFEHRIVRNLKAIAPAFISFASINNDNINNLHPNFFFSTNKKRWAYIQPPDLRNLFSATGPNLQHQNFLNFYYVCLLYSILYRGIHPDGEELEV